MSHTLSVAILTLNEAARIAACIASAKFADQVVVVDSGSSDNTRALAQQHGAQAFEYADWQGFGEQRTRALKHVTSDYVFFLDADELITPELQAELQSVTASGEDAIWKVVWTQVAFGRPLTRMAHSGGVTRLFKTSSLLRFDGAVHERAITTAALPTRILTSRLPHYSRETVYGSLLKLAQYVQLGAAKRAKAGKRGGILQGMASAFSIFVKNYFSDVPFCVALKVFTLLPAGPGKFFRYAALAYDKNDFLSKRQYIPPAS